MVKKELLFDGARCVIIALRHLREDAI